MNHFLQWIKDCGTSLKVLWGALPHQVQGGLLAFATVGLTTLSKELSELALGGPSFTLVCLRHDVAAAFAAGLIALRAFYMLPNRPDAAALPAAPEPPAAK